MSTPPAITYRTTDFSRWGAGLGANLSAVQVDGNFWALAQAILDLQQNPATGPTIVSVTSTGTGFSFVMSDGTILGPITLPYNQQLSFYLSFSLGGAFPDTLVDEWDGNYELFDVVLPVAVTLPAGLTTSPAPVCEIAPGAAVTLTLQQIHAGAATALGSVNFAAGAMTGTFTLLTQQTIPAGDRLRLYAPASVDMTMAGLAGTIAGTR